MRGIRASAAGAPHGGRYDAKRLFDVIVAAAALLLLAPLMLLIALAILIFMGRPVLFRQTRPGLHGRPFRMIKFRTMSERRDTAGELLDDSQRLTRLGTLLRTSSLDELPELWNVLIGDMSLVGPRPLLLEYLELYDEQQMRRHEVRPGITGYAQVQGRNAITWDERFAFDVWYVDNRSFLLDLKIILMTIRSVLSKEGISAEGEATMPRFRGNNR